METIDHRQPLGGAHPSRTGEPGKRVYRWNWSAGAWTDTGARRPPAVAPRAEAVGQRAGAQRLSTPRRPEPRAAPPSNRVRTAPRLEDPPPRRRRLEVLAPLLFGALCVLIVALLSLAGEA